MDSRLPPDSAGEGRAASHPRPTPPRLLASSPADPYAGQATVELASIMNVAAASPLSPGPSSPPLDQGRPQDFTPPARPSSTPFPQPDRSDGLCCLRCPMEDVDDGDVDVDVAVDSLDDYVGSVGCADDGLDSDTADELFYTPKEGSEPDAADGLLGLRGLQMLSAVYNGGDDDDDDVFSPSCSDPGPPPPRRRAVFLHSLPAELQGLILDHVFDGPSTPTRRSAPDKRLTRLACLSPVWRELIQQRLYCHIKLQATGATLRAARLHFAQYPHLADYVKHVELWFPVFQPKAKAPTAALTATAMLPLVTHEGLASAAYVLPSDNSSLEEAFAFVAATFAGAALLTLEGGERKKAPQVRHFAGPTPRAIPTIASVRTLVCKGQWNLIRVDADFFHMAAALPNMHEWRAAYSKPKSKSYLTMASILPQLPPRLTRLDVCLESDYRQEISFPPYFLKVAERLHFCTRLAEATPGLQHLTYTGRVCRGFFDVAARLADPRATRLQSVDLTVKNCCRHVSHWQESGSGITDIHFIHAFEALVLAAVRSLGRLTQLEHLRIRYVDLDFPVPPLNPFFLLHNGRASGVWSDTIVAELNRVRPETQWEELSETFGDMTISKDGRMVLNAEFPKKRIVSLKLSNYDYLAALATA